MDPIDHIKFEALRLAEGESTMAFCPYCQAKHEQKLRITCRNDKIFAKCYRASCGKFVVIDNFRASKLSKKKEFTPKFCKEPMVKLPERVSKFLYNHYELSDAQTLVNGFRYLPETERLYMPLRNKLGFIWGGVAKKLPGSPYKGTKVVIYKEVDAPRLHYTFGGISTPLVVVEDVLSAVKLTSLCNSIALLGTDIDDLGASQLVREASTIYLFLDYDAIDKANKIARKYRALADWKVIINKQDPKDTPYKELEGIIHDIRT